MYSLPQCQRMDMNTINAIARKSIGLYSKGRIISTTTTGVACGGLWDGGKSVKLPAYYLYSQRA